MRASLALLPYQHMHARCDCATQVRTGGLSELGALRAADVAGPLLLDIDLDYWGGTLLVQLNSYSRLAATGAVRC